MLFFRFLTLQVVLATVLLLLVGTVTLTSAETRSSTNYQLQSDSINIGGGASDSASYQQESTVGEIATGRSTSSNFGLNAGFQQMQERFISMTAPADVVLGPELPGLTGGNATGATAVQIITDSPGGYELYISATSAPAMQGPAGESIADYAPVGSDPDFSFITNSGQAVFGFSPDSPDRATRFRSTAGSCGGGPDSIAERCWDGLSTTNALVAAGSGGNQPTGATTTIYFQVGIGSGANVLEGTYVATTTLTAIML